MGDWVTVGNGHYLYLQTQFGEDRCTQFRVIMVTDPPTKNTPSHKQTGPITIHCTAASEQYNNNTKSGPSEQVSQSTSVHSASEALVH